VSPSQPSRRSDTHLRRPLGVKAPPLRAVNSRPSYMSAAASLKHSKLPAWWYVGCAQPSWTRQRVGPTKTSVEVGRSCKKRRGTERR
jgi:hypothetical protein